MSMLTSARALDHHAATIAASVSALFAPLLASAVLAAQPAAAQALPSPASIEGTLTISVLSPTLKHWGVPAAEAAFVPDADPSATARAIRAAADAAALCAAIEQAGRADTDVARAHVDGDGNLEHRSGDEARLEFRLSVPVASPTSGHVYVCSAPVIAIVTRGKYPDERFEQAEGHRIRWTGRTIALRPGEHARLELTASVDASQW